MVQELKEEPQGKMLFSPQKIYFWQAIVIQNIPII